MKYYLMKKVIFTIEYNTVLRTLSLKKKKKITIISNYNSMQKKDICIYTYASIL